MTSSGWKSLFLRLYYDLCFVCGCFIVLGTSLYLLPGNSFFQDLIRNFGHYLFLGHLLSALLLLPFCWLKKYYKAPILHLIGASCYLPVLVAFYTAPDTADLSCPHGRQESFSVFAINTEGMRAVPERLFQAIQKFSPDVVGIVELQPAYELPEMLVDYPYRIEIPQKSYFGMGLYSKVPFEVLRTDLGDDTDPALMVHFQDLDILLTLVHIIAPITPQLHYDGYLAFRRLMTVTRHECKRCIVLGDFNTTPFALRYQQLLRLGGLESVMAGRGFHRTWHTDSFFFFLPLDHILYKGLAAPDTVERVRVERSDHYGLYASFPVCRSD